MELDTLVNRFRIASRELFNEYFRVDDPYKNDEAWSLEGRYREIELLLFEKLVLEPALLPIIPYGTLQSNIRVELKHGERATIMLNREIYSGYWDYPLEVVTSEAKLAFISFFDWDQLDVRDHRYVRVQVTEWQSEPATIGKHALIEARDARFTKG
jgi:hypothetical protein